MSQPAARPFTKTSALWEVMYLAQTSPAPLDKESYAEQIRAVVAWVWLHIPFDYIDPETSQAYFSVEALCAAMSNEIRRAEEK